MSTKPTLLCPIDFSSSSLSALQCAFAIARRLNARVMALTVAEALLTAVGDTRMGPGWSHATAEQQLRELVQKARATQPPVDVTYEVRDGKAATTILDVARTNGAQLIVMSTHGRSGVGKWLLGALVPVDFSSATHQQVRVASRVADILQLRMIIGHVLEPIDLPLPEQINEAEISSERHRRACASLQSIALQVPNKMRPEILIASGPPAEMIAKWVTQTHAALLVMALHSDAGGGPRLGSVTYRAIALSRVLTLALPPAAVTQSLLGAFADPNGGA